MHSHIYEKKKEMPALYYDGSTVINLLEHGKINSLVILIHISHSAVYINSLVSESGNSSSHV